MARTEGRMVLWRGEWTKDFARECTVDPYGLHTRIPLHILFIDPGQNRQRGWRLQESVGFRRIHYKKHSKMRETFSSTFFQVLY